MFRFIFFYYRSHPSEQQQALTLGVQQEQVDDLATVEAEIRGEETLFPNPQSLTLGVELEPMECPQAGPAPLLSIKVLSLKPIPGQRGFWWWPLPQPDWSWGRRSLGSSASAG